MSQPTTCESRTRPVFPVAILVKVNQKIERCTETAGSKLTCLIKTYTGRSARRKRIPPSPKQQLQQQQKKPSSSKCLIVVPALLTVTRSRPFKEDRLAFPT